MFGELCCDNNGQKQELQCYTKKVRFKAERIRENIEKKKTAFWHHDPKVSQLLYMVYKSN